MKSWQQILEKLRRMALATSFYDREIREYVFTVDTSYCPGCEYGEVLADSLGRGSFQRL